MKYEEAIEAMRERAVDPAPVENLLSRNAAAKRNAIPPHQLRAAVIATAVAAVGFMVLGVVPVFVLPIELSAIEWVGAAIQHGLSMLLPAGVLIWALRLVRRNRLGPQILCRAIWWSNAIVGLLVAGQFATFPERALGAAISIACAVALLKTGRQGLDATDPTHPFSPVRFRGHLLLALVMAFADALTLMFSSLMQLRVGMAGWNVGATIGYAGPTIMAASVMAVAVWGVYRLRTWALLLNLLANITIAYLALSGVLNLSLMVSAALAVTAAIQCFIPVPILAAALGDRKAGQPLLSRFSGKLMPVSIVALALASVPMAVFFNTGEGWMTVPDAFRRGMERARIEAWKSTARAREQARRDSLPQGPFAGLDLSGEDLRSLSLTDESFRDAVLVGADFRGARLVDVSLENADLSRADLRGVDLHGVALAGARFDHARLEGAAASPEQWAQASSFEGATCPDGTEADESGCTGKFGMQSETWDRTVRVVESSGEFHCPPIGETKRFETTPGHALRFERRAWVRLHDGTLVSGGRKMKFDEENGRIELPANGCRRVVYAFVDGSLAP